MASTHTTLDAAANDRKARLAKLASLKRKQPSDSAETPATDPSPDGEPTNDESSTTDVYLSGRNYDISTRGPKLGFENAPSTGAETLEQKAELIATDAATQAAKDEEQTDKGIDLFKLQPKKPNWDLKRDLEQKMKILDVRTQNAIARLVRERIQGAKQEAKRNNGSGSLGTGEGEEVGIDGSTLVQGVHVREREEEEDERREREQDEEDGIE